MTTNPAPDVNSQPPPLAEAKSFLGSKTFWILLIGFIGPVVAKKFGWEFSDADTQRVAEMIVQLMTSLGALWARGKAQGPLRFSFTPGAVLLAAAALTLLFGDR